MAQKIVPIKGMHCKSCELMISEKLEDIPGVKATVKLSTKSAYISARHLPSDDEIRNAVEAAGYEVGHEVASIISRDKKVYRDIAIGLAIVLFISLLLWGSNLTNLSTVTTSTSGAAITALMIGLTAGLSTCMALIGGLVLGISAQHAKRYPNTTLMQRFRPHIAFNVGRIIGFTLFGAAIGAVGSALQLSGSALGWMMILTGFVMLILGLNLTDMFPRLKNITLPSNLAEKVGLKRRGRHEYSSWGAVTTGSLTFFLPCGFTQSMQLMAVGSGSAMTGALIMGMFAVGTTPGLLAIGGLTSAVKGTFAKSFFRVAGVIVIVMAMINLANGANLAHLRLPDFKSEQKITAMSEDTKKLETVYYLKSDISPSQFTTKVGQKTALIVDVKEDGQGCMSTIMIPGLDDRAQFLQSGKKIILTFTPTAAGDYPITCAMGIPRGVIKVEA